MNNLFILCEDKWIKFINSIWIAKRGYLPKIIPYISYGSENKVHILARVVLKSPKQQSMSFLRRGLRTLFSAQVPNIAVEVNFKSSKNSWSYIFKTDRGGYINQSIDTNTNSGWHNITFKFVEDYQITNRKNPKKHIVIQYEKIENFSEEGKLMIVDSKQKYGVISDIDDTVMISHAPNPMLGSWSVFGSSPHKRKAVKGMSDLYAYFDQNLLKGVVFYVSGAPWNVFATLKKFLIKNSFPAGPIILQDLGPNDGSYLIATQKHKLEVIDRLFLDFPDVKWILIGDSGQKDPQTYQKFIKKYQNNIQGVLIRQLKPKIRAASHHFTKVAQFKEIDNTVPIIYGHDGFSLLASYKEHIEKNRK